MIILLNSPCAVLLAHYNMCVAQLNCIAEGWLESEGMDVAERLLATKREAKKLFRDAPFRI